MFGLVPRTVWSRAVETDDRDRITVQHNCLLLERADEPTAVAGSANAASLASPRLVLIETGTGDKLDAKSKDIFDLEDRSILDALHEADCRPEDIEAVFVSHLHFDHAGGLTRLPRPGEAPDWIGPGSAGSHGVKRSFPNARVYVQARERFDAINNTSVMTRTYFRDHLDPVLEQMVSLESPPPFSPGLIPLREEMPTSPVMLRRTQAVEGVHVFLAPGHTWGQQAVMFEDDRGRPIVFTPDVMPTVNHVGAAYSLGYDVEPYTSMMTKRWFLDAAAQYGWLLVLDHEPGNPCVRVTRNGRGWFDLAPEE